VILLLAACATGDGAGQGTAADSGQEVQTPAAWDREDDAQPADHDLTVLQDALRSGIAALVVLDPTLLFQAYADSLGHGTESCPGLFPSVGVMTAWSADCTTPEGWGFSGRGQAAWFPSLTIEGRVFAPYGEFINSSTITHPSGAALLMDGSGMIEGWSEGSVDLLRASLLGTFAFTGGETEDWTDPGWLAAGPSVALDVERSEEGSGRTTSLEGGISGAFAEGIVAVRAEGLAVEEDGSCTATGALVLVGEDGQHYRLELPEGCVACAELLRADLSHGDRALGEACFDLSPLVAWTERPW